MKALTISEVGRTEFREVDAPVPGDGEVLLKVAHVGLCGSDLNTFRGVNPLAALPRIPGHEIGGSILRAGRRVPEELATGSRALVIPYTECGTCRACRTGRTHACRYNATLGVQRDGGMTEMIAVPWKKVILNAALPPRHLALVEPLSVGFHAVERGGVAAGETVVVIGGGMIGVGAMLGALDRGARVIAIEPSRAKEETLRALGVSNVIDPGNGDQRARVEALTGGDGADLAIEAVGLPETFRLAVDLVGFAARVVFVGYAKAEVAFNTSLFNLKELDIFGSRNATRADFSAVAAFLEARPEVGEMLISRVFTWDEADGALPYWESHRNETFKIMVELGDG